jgi:hypothetical protein
VTMPTALLRMDPTRLTTLRRAFMAGFRGRLRRLKVRLREGLPRILTAGEGAESMTRTLNSFLSREVTWALGLVEGMTQHWWDETVDRVYVKGIERAYDDARKGDRNSAAYSGGRAEFIRSVLAIDLPNVSIPKLPTRNALTVNAVQARDVFGRLISEKAYILAERLGGEVKNLSQGLIQEIAREVTDGVSKGLSAKEIGAAIERRVDISLGRANRIAQTELTRIHAEGQLDAMQKLGVRGVQRQVEWILTSGISCELCQGKAGDILTVEQARGLIPLHPNCMCAWRPAEVKLPVSAPKGPVPPAKSVPAQEPAPVKTVPVVEAPVPTQIKPIPLRVITLPVSPAPPLVIPVSVPPVPVPKLVEPVRKSGFFGRLKERFFGKKKPAATLQPANMPTASELAGVKRNSLLDAPWKDVYKVDLPDGSFVVKHLSKEEAVNEVLASSFAEKAGVRMPAVKEVAGVPGSPGKNARETAIVQPFVKGSKTMESMSAAERVKAVRALPKGDAERHLAYNYLIGADDRDNLGNYLFANGRLVEIDNGLAFKADTSAWPVESSEVFKALGKTEAERRAKVIPADALRAMSQSADDMAKVLEADGRPKAAEALRVRGRVLGQLSEKPKATLGDLIEAASKTTGSS